MADGNGLATVLQVLGARGAVDGDGGEQGDMFEADAPLPLEPKGKSGPKGGRPAGARNRSTEEWCRYMLSQYRSPLVVLAELYSRPVADLVDELQALANKHAREERHERTDGSVVIVKHAARIDPMEVLRAQMAAAQALAPYLHKQQPKAIEVEQRQPGLVVIGDLGGAEDVSDDLALPLPKSEENQGGDVGARSQSDAQLQPQNDKASDDSGLAFRDD